jgi:hypothetical protein
MSVQEFRQLAEDSLPHKMTRRWLAGAKLCTYAAGANTPPATYADSTARTPNTSPTVLDVNGRVSVWIGPQLYKFVLRTGGDGTCSTEPSSGRRTM